MAPSRAHRPFVPCLCFTLLLLASPTSWAQEEADAPVEVSDEVKLAALEQKAALAAAEEEEARLKAEEEAANFKAEEAKMQAMAEDAAKKQEDAERLAKEAKEEENALKAKQAHLESLEREAAAKAAEQKTASEAASSEKAAFNSEQAKNKALQGDAARKAAAMGTILKEEERLVAKMNEKSAGDDILAMETSTLADMPMSSGGDIFDKLANAKAAGLDSKEYAALEAKAKKLASEELKQAAASTTHNARRLTAAFVNAERAGISTTEHSAAKASVLTAAQKRLESAKGAANVTTASTIQELANALSVGRSVGVDRETLDSAAKVYERQAAAAFAHKDLRHGEVFMHYSHTAEVNIPPGLVAWVKMSKRLKAATTMIEDTPSTLATLLSMVTEAKAMGLPNTTDLSVVEKRVQAWSSSHLKNSSKVAANLTQVEFQELLVKVENAREAGISSSDVTMASQQVLSVAKSQLNEACGVQPKLYDASKLKTVFVDAERAGVPESERAAARSKVVAGIEKQLQSLTVASSKANSSTGNASLRSKEFVAELVHAILMGDRFSVAEAEMINARNFYRKQCETALTENHLSYAEALVEFAGPVSVTVPDTLKSWVKMWKRLREAKAIPDDRKGQMSTLLSMVVEAKSMGLPNSSDFATVEEKVKTWAAADLKAASPKGGNFTSDDSFTHLLDALEQAKSAGVTSAELKAADAQVHSWASSELSKACKSKPYDAGRIKGAFNNAERAGVSEATRAQALDDLRRDVERQLMGACSNTSTNTSKAHRSAEFVSELTQSLWLASRFSINETVMTKARNFYEEQGKTALREKDFHYAELLVESAAKAGCDVPSELRVWVDVLKRLREAEKLPVGRTDQLPSLLDTISTAKSIGLDKNKHLAAVEAKAKQMAAADVKAEL